MRPNRSKVRKTLINNYQLTLPGGFRILGTHFLSRYKESSEPTSLLSPLKDGLTGAAMFLTVS